MSVDLEPHLMRFVTGLLGVGILALVAVVVTLIGAAGAIVLVALAVGVTATYLLGALTIAVLDRMDR